MFCIKCGKQIEGARFCPFCGAEQITAAQPQQAVQPGAAVQPQPVQPQPGVQPQPQVVYVAQPQPAPQPVKEAPKKKKFPVALLVIGIIAAVLLFLLVIVIVVIIIIAVIGGKAVSSIVNSPGGGSSNSVIGSLVNELNSEGFDYNNFFDGDGYDNNGYDYDGYDYDGYDFSQGYDIPQGLSGNYVGEPTLGDFAWFENARDTGFDTDGAKWLDGSDITGNWKGYIRYDDSQKELTYMTIAITPQEATLLIDWYRYSDGYALDPLEDMEDTYLTGYEWGNGILVDGEFKVEMDQFWEKDGIQYGSGILTAYDGSRYEVAMMRP